MLLSMSLCMAACISQKPHAQTSPHFLSMLLLVVAESFSSGVAIGLCHLLPDLWMTLCFPIQLAK